MFRFGESFVNFKPLPCVSLRTGTQVMAAAGLVVNGGLLGLIIYNFIYFLALPRPDDNQIPIYITVLVMRQMELLLGIFLLIGAIKDNYRICRTWLIISTVIFIIDTVSCTLYLITAYNLIALGVSLSILFFQLYQLIVVFAFMEQIRFTREYRKAISPMPILLQDVLVISSQFQLN